MKHWRPCIKHHQTERCTGSIPAYRERKGVSDCRPHWFYPWFEPREAYWARYRAAVAASNPCTPLTPQLHPCTDQP